MIPEKSLKTKSPARTVLRITPDFLKHSDRVRDYRLLNCRVRENAFAAAEGIANVRTLSGEPTALYFVENLICYTTSTYFYLLPSGKSYSIVGEKVKDVAAYYDEAGTLYLFFLTNTRLHCILNDSRLFVTGMGGGNCLAVHRERLFVANDYTLFYSQPLSPGTFSIALEDTGKIPLDKRGGKVLALISHGGMLYLVRQREILRIRADANDLNFRIEKLDFDGGTIAEGSVQDCGKYIVLRTARGLATIDGTVCRLVRPAREELVLGAAAGHGGRYFALATHRGESCFYVYDPEGDTEYFMRGNASAIAGGWTSVFYLTGNIVGALTDESDYAEKRISITLDIGASDGSKRRIDGVTVFGNEGTYIARFKTEEGEAEMRLAAGKREALPSVLCGETLEFSLSCSDRGSVVTGINLHMREERV